MRKVLFVLVGIFAAVAAFADDGSWSDSRGYTPAEGALYSVAGNQDISLEKEFLQLVDGKAGSTRAVFLFRNASPSAVTVECAFPIRIEWYVSEYSLPAERLGGRGSAEVPGWDFGGAGKYAAQARGPYSLTIADWLKVLGVAWQPYTSEDPSEGGKFIRADAYPKGRRELPATALLSMLDLSIRQDGKEVPVASCVVDYGQAPGLVTLHFRHQLTMAGSASSRVEVSYAFPSGSEASGNPMTPGYAETYQWRYILETGASWKGPIGSLVLALPPEFEGSLPKALTCVGFSKGYLLYSAAGWEPGRDQNIDVSATVAVRTPGDMRPIWSESPRLMELDSVGWQQEGVEVLGASSTLADTADVYLPMGVVPKAPFDAARLFDGIRETCWAEGKTTDGIGEYVRFRLTARMAGLVVQNGFLRSTIDLPEKATWSYFEKNNRVKALEIQRDDGEMVERLTLTDTRDLQYFGVDLAPGTYRAVIASVYPGSKWKDTCLGELTFLPGDGSAFAALQVDPFFKEFVVR